MQIQNAIIECQLRPRIFASYLCLRLFKYYALRYMPFTKHFKSSSMIMSNTFLVWYDDKRLHFIRIARALLIGLFVIFSHRRFAILSRFRILSISQSLYPLHLSISLQFAFDLSLLPQFLCRTHKIETVPVGWMKQHKTS